MLSMLSSAQVARCTVSVLRWILAPVTWLGFYSRTSFISNAEYLDDDMSAVATLVYILSPCMDEQDLREVSPVIR